MIDFIKGLGIVAFVLFVEIPTEIIEAKRAQKYKDWSEPIPSLPEELKKPPELWAGFCWHKDSYRVHFVEDGEFRWCKDCSEGYHVKNN